MFHHWSRSRGVAQVPVPVLALPQASAFLPLVRGVVFAPVVFQPVCLYECYAVA